MNPILAFVFLFAVASAATTEVVKGGEPAKLNDAIIAKYGEQPCLNKVIGQRLTHPTDPHKFLRCMSLEALWIETCPDGLFYNPSMELCDWSTKPRPTTRTNEVVKHRPVLFKTKVQDGQISSEIVDASRDIETRPAVEETQPSVRPQNEMPATETVTPSLLDELRKKLNLDTVDRTNRLVSEDSEKKRPVLRLIEVTTSGTPVERTLDDEPSSKKTLRLVEKPSERTLDDEPSSKKTLRLIEKPVESDFVVQASSTSRRMFLKSLEKSAESDKRESSA